MFAAPLQVNDRNIKAVSNMFGLDESARASCASQLSKCCLYYKLDIRRKFDNA